MVQYTLLCVISGEEVAVPAKKTKTVVSTSQISQTKMEKVNKTVALFVYFKKNLHLI